MVISGKTNRRGSGRKKALGGLLFLVAALAGCAPRQETFQGGALGTTYMVKVVGAGGVGRHVIQGAIMFELDLVDAKMSTYREDSELSRFNRFTGSEPFPMSEETLEVFRRAMAISEETEGAFDITVGPLVNAWGFGPESASPDGPDDATLAALRERVGYRNLIIEEGAVRKSRPDIHCDLSAIAKGYAAERIARALDRLQVSRYLVEVGGEIVARGHNAQGRPWRVGIERPMAGQRNVLHIVELRQQAMATSGDYRNYYERDGLFLSHLIDPRTGRPIAHGLASVTVIHDSCTDADAYATALIVLGPEEGYAVAGRLGLAALFILRDEQGDLSERRTSRFKVLE